MGLFVPGWGATARLYERGLPGGWEALELPSYRTTRGELRAYRDWLAGKLVTLPMRYQSEIAWLEQGNMAEGFRLYNEAFAADEYYGPALLKLLDAPSYLWLFGAPNWLVTRGTQRAGGRCTTSRTGPSRAQESRLPIGISRSSMQLLTTPRLPRRARAKSKR